MHQEAFVNNLENLCDDVVVSKARGEERIYASINGIVGEALTRDIPDSHGYRLLWVDGMKDSSTLRMAYTRK